MKKIFSIILGISLVFGLSLLTFFNSTVEAAKPASNLAGSEKVEWNLSADVMPSPPYGRYDIPGSEIKSKLLVNQPNGNTEVSLTGVMKDLSPNSTYKVYLSKKYTSYKELGWDVIGDWTINIQIGNDDVLEHLTLHSSDDKITGELFLPGGTSVWVIDSVEVNGNNIILTGHYDTNLNMQIEFTGKISSDGTMSGDWEDTNGPLQRSGTWAINEKAEKIIEGNTGWTGLFTSSIQPFQFMTDEYGSGSWHINIKDEDYSQEGDKALSVWINSGGTLLISDVFHVIFE